MAVGGVGLFFVGIAFLFVYIIYVAGEGKTYKDILWTMSWATSTLGMAMFAVLSIVEKSHLSSVQRRKKRWYY